MEKGQETYLQGELGQGRLVPVGGTKPSRRGYLLGQWGPRGVVHLQEEQGPRGVVSAVGTGVRRPGTAGGTGARRRGTCRGNSGQEAWYLQ